jgi:hypothetical protein
LELVAFIEIVNFSSPGLLLKEKVKFSIKISSLQRAPCRRFCNIPTYICLVGGWVSEFKCLVTGLTKVPTSSDICKAPRRDYLHQLLWDSNLWAP